MSEEPRFGTFSVGVKPETDDLRRGIMDAVALVNGRDSRLQNHTFCFQRIMEGLDSLMLDAPDSFAMLFGDGEAVSKSRFLKWLREGHNHVR